MLASLLHKSASCSRSLAVVIRLPSAVSSAVILVKQFRLPSAALSTEARPTT
jgi:hypothetical protein